MSFLKILFTDIVFIGLLVLLTLAVGAYVLAEVSFAHKCELKGGHVKDTSSVGIGIKGGISIVPSNLCLSPDGRILE